MIGIVHEELPLSGLNIVLSGAVPEPGEWLTADEDMAIMQFVATFSGIVFKRGGRIVHGFHPSFTPILVKQAKAHQQEGGVPCLSLFRSRYFSSAATEWVETFSGMRSFASLMDIDAEINYQYSPTENRNRSLSILRKEMMNSGNVFVTVGGKWHKESGFASGVKEEVSLASARGMPLFILGAFGGEASSVAATDVAWNNDLPQRWNDELASTRDVVSVVGRLTTGLYSKKTSYLQRELEDLTGAKRLRKPPNGPRLS